MRTLFQRLFARSPLPDPSGCGRTAQRPRQGELAALFRAVLFRAILLLAVVSVCQPLQADTRFQLVQFLPEQGLSQSQVTCLLQDHHGYLWVGTRSGGLNRFDGHRFRTFRRADGLNAAHVRVLSQHNNQLYAGTRQGLFQLKEDRFEPVKTDPAQSLDINFLTSLPDGKLLAGSSSGLFQVEGDGLVPLTIKTPLPDPRLWDAAVTSDGALWLLSPRWLGTLTGDQLQFVEIPDDLTLTTLHASARAGLWVGTRRGLYRVQDGQLIPYQDASSTLSQSVVSLMSDRDGRLLVATRKGVVVLQPDAPPDAVYLTTLDGAAGMPSSMVRSMLEDREGNLFFGTDGEGLLQLPRQPFEPFVQPPFEDYAPAATLVDGGRRRWIATYGQGLWYLDGNRATMIGEDQGLTSQDAYSLLLVSPDTLWVATLNGLFEGKLNTTPFSFKPLWTVGNNTVIDLEADESLRYVSTENGLWTYDGRRWKNYGPPELPSKALYDLLKTPDGKLWVSTQDQGAFLWNPASRQVELHLKPEEELPAAFVLSLYLHKDGTLYLGTEEGLVAYKDGKTELFTSRDGLPDDTITFVTASPSDGSLWVGTNRGVGARFDGQWRRYGRRQGLPGEEINTGAVSWDQEGNLWVGTVHGYAILRQYPPLRNEVPPLVHLEQIQLPEKLLPPDASVELAHHQNSLRFTFVGLSLTDPQNISYRYRLVGLEEQWLETDQREVRYPALPPGTYQFEVTASNNDGLWAPQPATFPFSIQPPWWQTWWARSLQALALFASGLVAYSYRARRIERLNEHLEQLVQERTKELQLEKDKSEKLLLNILPGPIAEELREQGVATTRLYEDVTILVTDFQDFTRTCATLSPEKLVEELNEVFAAFDEICRAHRLEKLKTIGDAFMAASGLPTPTPHHAVDAVEAAVEMMDFLIERNQLPHKIPLQLRIGIHTGPVVAGVIGRWKFAYDIWGDAVNTAARMESSGMAGEINVSRATYDRIKHIFVCDPRGQVLAKGKGALEMFFVRGRVSDHGRA